MATYDNKSDEELVTLLRQGDEKITDYLMEKYKNLVRKKAGTMYIIGADRDDLIQEGMIGLYKAIRDYSGDMNSSFITFADLCVSRQMYKAVEAGNRKKHLPLNSYISLYSDSTQDGHDDGIMKDVSKLIGDVVNNPEEMVIDKESTQKLENDIYESLSEFERNVLQLHMTGMGYVEIAKILGKNEKSTDNALNRIKSKVRKLSEIHHKQD